MFTLLMLVVGVTIALCILMFVWVLASVAIAVITDLIRSRMDDILLGLAICSFMYAANQLYIGISGWWVGH